VTNSLVFTGHVLFSRPVLAVFYEVMKMSWFSKKTAGKDQLYCKI